MITECFAVEKENSTFYIIRTAYQDFLLVEDSDFGFDISLAKVSLQHLEYMFPEQFKNIKYWIYDRVPKSSV